MNRKVLILLISFLSSAYAETPAAEANSAVTASIKYIPPMRGAPASRVGGGSRGAGNELPTLQILAPDHTGLTIQEQPTLFWFVSKPAEANLEVTVINEQVEAPLLERNFVAPSKAGIQKLKLSDFGIKLQPNIEYRWYVSLVVDKNERSNDIIASGTIIRTVPSAELLKQISLSKKSEYPEIYASNGIWYDALSSISDLIESAPQNTGYFNQRAELLSQIGLTAVQSK